VRILFIGDIFGRPGRISVREHLPEFVRQRPVDLVIANAENAAGGFGLTAPICEELFDLNIAVLTTGNHVWDKREIIEYLQTANGNPHSPARRVLRPANYPAGTPGVGMYEGRVGDVPYAVINLQGRVFLPQNDDPFRVADALIAKTQAQITIVDMHAEATSEKVAMGWYLDGRVTAVLGTHTHIPTADTRILPGGTAYQTDVGMTGPYDSVIGVQKELVIQRFLTNMPARWESAQGDVHFCGVYLECDDRTGRATAVERIMIPGHQGASL
jgi:metallophosphoesterase (TIGR00282 family)